MTSKRRKAYKRKAQKNKKSFSFKTLLVIAIIIIAAFFIWQLVITLSQQNKNESTLMIPEKSEEKLPTGITGSAVESAINYALERLEIPQKFIKTYSQSDKIIKKITIDNNELDLSIANIFITDKVEEAEGQIISVEESKDGNSIEMRIFDPKNKKYFVLKIKNDIQNLYEKTCRLSIIIDDFGEFGGEFLDEFLALDKNITFSILPELSQSQKVMQKAYNQGRETFIHIPMEPTTYPQNNPGKNAIFVHLTEKEIEKRMKNYIKNLPLCIGGNNHMGSLATQHKNVMMPVLKIFKEKNLIFVDSRTTSKTIGYSLAKEMKIPTYLIDFFLDSMADYENRAKRMSEKILKYAETQNKIVVITHCKKESLDDLKQILKNIAGKNIILVPISEIVKPKEYVL